ncbi:MAG: hypothetical protein CMJ69_01305 [Planctomycetaceae bacterium]|nr:hypothetical protein [Planctomycetaceae bacterium]
MIGSNRDDVDNNDPDQLQLMSLYEAMIAVPHVLDCLSLPVGCQVVFSDGNPVVLQDYEELEIPKGSYLDRRSKAKAHGFRTTRYLTAMIYLIAGKLDLKLPAFGAATHTK